MPRERRAPCGCRCGRFWEQRTPEFCALIDERLHSEGGECNPAQIRCECRCFWNITHAVAEWPAASWDDFLYKLPEQMHLS